MLEREVGGAAGYCSGQSHSAWLQSVRAMGQGQIVLCTVCATATCTPKYRPLRRQPTAAAQSDQTLAGTPFVFRISENGKMSRSTAANSHSRSATAYHCSQLRQRCDQTTPTCVGLGHSSPSVRVPPPAIPPLPQLASRQQGSSRPTVFSNTSVSVEPANTQTQLQQDCSLDLNNEAITAHCTLLFAHA